MTNEIIRVNLPSGASVAIKDDCTLHVDSGADLKEAAAYIASNVTPYLKMFESPQESHDLIYLLQLRNSKGAVLSVKMNGDVVASDEWAEDVVAFAQAVGKELIGRKDAA